MALKTVRFCVACMHGDRSHDCGLVCSTIEMMIAANESMSIGLFCMRTQLFACQNGGCVVMFFHVCLVEMHLMRCT